MFLLIDDNEHYNDSSSSSDSSDSEENDNKYMAKDCAARKKSSLFATSMKAKEMFKSLHDEYNVANNNKVERHCFLEVLDPSTSCLNTTDEEDNEGILNTLEY